MLEAAVTPATAPVTPPWRTHVEGNVGMPLSAQYAAAAAVTAAELRYPPLAVDAGVGAARQVQAGDG